MKIGVQVKGSMRDMLRQQGRDLAVPISNAVAKAGLDLRETLRAQVRAAGLGQRLPNTWRLDVYPKARFAYAPAAVVSSRAPEIIRAFNEGTLIRANNAQYLAIPTKAAPARGKDGKRISPTNWPGTGRYGRLRLIYVRSGLGWLVVDLPGKRRPRERRGAIRSALPAVAGERDGQRFVVMFVLVPAAKMPKLLDIEAAAQAALQSLQRDLRGLLPE